MTDDKEIEKLLDEVPSYTEKEQSEAVAYALLIENYAQNLVGNMPTPIRAKLRAYCRQPTLELRDVISDEITSAVLRATKDSYEDTATEELPDIHERALFFMASYARASDIIHHRETGNETTPSHQSGLLTKIAGQVGWSLPAADEESINKIMRTSGALLSTHNPVYAWYHTRLAQAANALDSKRVTLDAFKDIEVDEAEARMLRDANDELAQTITFLQKYLPKDCVAPALPGQETKEWLVSPPFRIWKSNRYHPSHDLKIAIFGSDSPIDTSGSSEEHYTGNGINMQLSYLPGLMSKNITITATVGPDGELYSTQGERIFDYLPAEYRPAYEVLRAEALYIYHDSVVPVYITELADQEVAMVEAAAKHSDGVNSDSMAGKLRRLVLARKLLDETLRTEIIDELENPDRDVTHRKMVKHEVTGHIRKLPKRFKASAVARELCLKEMGRELAEYGETYVKVHSRGKLEDSSAGHKASFVAGRMATARGSGNDRTE